MERKTIASARRWQDVKRLAGEGASQREIAKQLQINRRTVAKMAAAEAPPQASRRRGSQLDSLMDTIAEALSKEPQISAPQLTERLRIEHGYRALWISCAAAWRS